MRACLALSLPAGLTYDDAKSGKLFKISIDQAEVRKKSYANNKAKNNETRKLVRALEKALYPNEPTPSQLKQRKYNRAHRQKLKAQEEEQRLLNPDAPEPSKLEQYRQYSKEHSVRKMQEETPEEAEQRKAKKQQYMREYKPRRTELRALKKAERERVREAPSAMKDAADSFEHSSSGSASGRQHSSAPSTAKPTTSQQAGTPSTGSPYRPNFESAEEATPVSAAQVEVDPSTFAAASHDFDVFKRTSYSPAADS